MGVSKGVVEAEHDVGGEKFVDVSEGVDDGVEFADDVGDVVVPGEGVVDFEAEKFCCWFLGEVPIVS